MNNYIRWILGRGLLLWLLASSCLLVNETAARQRDVPPANQFDFMIGDWLVAGRRMTPDRKWNPFNAILRVRRIETVNGSQLEERWVQNGLDVEGAPNLGRTFRTYDAATMQWISQYESGIPPMMWPPTGRFEVDAGGIRMEPTQQSDPTGDHSKRVNLRRNGGNEWGFVVERSYDGEQQWFPVQDFAACRLFPERIPQSRVETILGGYDGSRSVAVDSIGNVFLGARFIADSTDDVPLIRLRPDGAHDVILRGYHPAGIAISDGWIYVHSSQVSNTGEAVLIRLQPGEREEVLGRVPGAALAVDTRGNALTANWPDSTIFSITPAGRRVPLLTDAAVPTTLGMYYERDGGAPLLRELANRQDPSHRW